MKKLWLLTVIFLFPISITCRIQGQTNQPQLDQLKLMQQFLGKWQAPYGKDTIMTVEFQQFGKAFVENDGVIIKGKESIDSKWSYSFSPKDSKFKIFVVYLNGQYGTLTGSFTSDKKWVQEVVQDLNPEQVLARQEFVFETPTSVSVIGFDVNGVKNFESKLSKIK